MFDDPAVHFHEAVVCAFEDYLDVKNTLSSGRNRDIKTALIVATALYHFREHLPDSLAIDWMTTCRQCPDYKLLGDIVNASKHGVLNREAHQA